MDMNYYNNYLLDDVTVFDLTDDDKKLLDACIWMVDNNATFRVAAENCDYTRSTLCRHVHQRLPLLSCGLYRVLVDQLRSHL